MPAALLERNTMDGRLSDGNLLHRVNLKITMICDLEGTPLSRKRNKPAILKHIIRAMRDHRALRRLSMGESARQRAYQSRNGTAGRARRDTDLFRSAALFKYAGLNALASGLLSGS